MSRESPILTGATSQVLPRPHHPRCGFMARTVLIAAIAAVALTACGQEICECIGNPPVTPRQRFDVSVTEQDHTVSMHVGQRLEVVLHAGKGLKPWTHPTSNNMLVLGPIVDPAATAAQGVTLAAFQANAAGNALVTANASPDCPSNQPCPQYIAVYNLGVTVLP